MLHGRFLLAQGSEALAESLRFTASRNLTSILREHGSGELIHWGTKFNRLQDQPKQTSAESAALRLLQFIQSEDRYRSPLDRPEVESPINGKFP